MAAKSAHQRIDLSVRPASAYRMQIDIGRVEPEQHGVGGRICARCTTRTAGELRPSRPCRVVLSAGLSSWLVNYDNYCSEQIVSMSMPQLVASKWAVGPALCARPAAGQDERRPVALASQIDALRSRQNGEGGFGVWAATPDADPFISAYAMHFLLEARDRGVDVPKDCIDAGNRYLQQLAGDDSLSSLDELRQRAYAVYLLTRQGNVTTNDLAAVQKRLQDAYPKVWKDDLAAGVAGRILQAAQAGQAGRRSDRRRCSASSSAMRTTGLYLRATTTIR